MQRNKGASFERQIENMLIDAGFTAKRNYDQAALGGFDIVIDRVPVAIECKRAARPLINQWWKQTVDQAGDLHPILIYKLDRREIRARVRMSLIDRNLSDDHIIELDTDGLVYLLREVAR